MTCRSCAAQSRQPRQQIGVRRARQQGRQQRVFLGARDIDFIDGGGRFGDGVKVGAEPIAGDAGHCFNSNHPLRRNANPIRDRRLRNTNFISQRANATSRLDRFAETAIPHDFWFGTIEQSS